MKISRVLFFLITTLAITSCSEQTSRSTAPIVYAEEKDPELEKAKQEALETLDYFIKSFQKNSNDTIFEYSVKMDFIDNVDHEHMWIMVKKFENGVFSGYLGNEPQIVKNVKVGQYIIIDKELIEDWLIMDTKTGNWEGGYSIKVLLNRKN
jgi:uncharacterized protein YegJ (DUF2314 family)